MSKTLLYPMTVSAKVLKAPLKVPVLKGDPFKKDATLEAGVHVHWALPDSLTASKLLPDKGTKAAVFPGVPDLWLVVRFNPGASSATPLAKRSWSGWVVDSIANTVTPLAQWSPPSRNSSLVHTFAGVLPNASSVGHSGWGVWDMAGSGVFDPAMAAYYPESRQRLGFWDKLDGIADKNKGNVSYLVVGWFSNDQHDPLSVAHDAGAVLSHWQAASATQMRATADIAVPVNLSTSAAKPPVWDVNIQQKPPVAAPQLRVDAYNRRAARSGTIQSRIQQTNAMKMAFPQVTATGPSSWVEAAATSHLTYLARHTVCHGAVVAVPLAGSNTIPVKIQTENVRLYPNVKRAMADVASKSADPTQVDALEMLLGDLESQKYSTGGVVDMPGAAHSFTFQSVPGKAKSYARIDVEQQLTAVQRAPNFSLMQSPVLSNRSASGYWPQMQARSASSYQKSRLSEKLDLTIFQPPVMAGAGPTKAQKDQFAKNVQDAFEKAKTNAQNKGISLDPRRVRVQDSRTNARSLKLGPTSNDAGSDAAGWWLDIQDDEALGYLLESTSGARVSMPSENNLHHIPGPRWYRPWSPQVVLTNIGRSYKFGFDTRFRADGKVQTRLAGDTVVSMTVGKQTAVAGRDLVATPQLFSAPGLPSEVVSLVRETLLLDTESAGVMSSAGGGSQAEYTNAIRGIWLTRDARFDDDALKAIDIDGEVPSPLAITPWQEPFDPLFIDTSYSHPHSALDAWQLAPSAVELSPTGPGATSPAAGQVEVLQERSMVTATVVNVLQSALVTKIALDPLGRRVPAQKVDDSLESDTFVKMDVISASLTKLDSQLLAKGYRLRAGSLRLNQIDVVDMFGLTNSWNSGISPTEAATDVTSRIGIALPPRLPYWSRFNFRLLSAANPAVEADAYSGPVCGLLLPDFLEHALEVFDGDGNGLGQLSTDRPRTDAAEGVVLKVKYTPHPWLVPDPDPFHHLTNSTLKSLVKALTEQQFVVPKNCSWAETGLSAMLRTIDTIRGTFDPDSKTAEHKVTLIGEPILVLGGRLQFNGTASNKTADLAGDPPLLNAPPAMPTLQIRIGDVTRPDDGVLGLFFAGATPADSHFAPVSKEAADKAIVNSLTMFHPNGWVKASHPFVADQESKVALPANTPVNIVILTDIRHGIYATCGELPRKKITMPKEFIEPAVRSLEPSFFTGPILTTDQFDSEVALIPPPEVAGYSAEFLYQKPGESTYSESAVPAAPPLSDLPKSRVLLTDGWLRMVPVKKQN